MKKNALLTDLAMYYQTRFKQVIFLQRAKEQFEAGVPEDQMYYSLLLWADAMDVADAAWLTRNYSNAYWSARGKQ